jgi:hypothetical protein
MTTHEDLGIILIESALVVTNSRHVLDDNSVIGVLTLLVKDGVSLDHVVDNVRLGNFLGAELLLRAKVLSVVVAEMVVAGNRGQLDTSADQEVNEGGLHLGLARLEVITANESVVLLSQINGTRHEGVLGGTVDERSALQNRGDGKNSRRRDFLVAILDSLEEVLGSIINASSNFGKTLSVGGPLDDDLVQTVVGLEVTKYM